MLRRYGYAWITIAFFLISFGLHWLFGWFAFVDEAAEHGASVDVSEYVVQMSRDTFENWQSEFLQLLWQVVGLAYFLYVGSPSSKENDDRTEVKLDAILRALGGEKANQVIAEIDREYERHGSGPTPHDHGSDISKTAGLELHKADRSK